MVSKHYKLIHKAIRSFFKDLILFVVEKVAIHDTF